MNIGEIMISELHQEQKDKYILPDSFYMRCLNSKFMEKESKIEAARVSGSIVSFGIM